MAKSPQEPWGQDGWNVQPPEQSGPSEGWVPGSQYPQQSGYQQGWGQPGDPGVWHQQQASSSGPPTGRGPGGKLPLLIAVGVVGVLILAVSGFVGMRTLANDSVADPGARQSQEEPSGTVPTSVSTSPGSSFTKAPSGGPLGTATGQAKAATDKLTEAGYRCSDLFNGAQGAHRGCFKYEAATQAEAVFQFTPDGSLTGVRILSYNSDNVNNAASTFDAALQAVGIGAFGGSEVAKIQTALKTGQKSDEVATSWGEFRISNYGDTVRLTGHKSGSDSLEVMRRQFDTTEAALNSALKSKRYDCSSPSCRKKVGDYGSQSVSVDSSSGGLRTVRISATGDPGLIKAAFPVVTADAFAVLRGGDITAIRSWVATHPSGQSHVAYVSGWRVELIEKTAESYGRQELNITSESFYV